MLSEKIEIEVCGRKLSVEFEGITPLELQVLTKELTQKMERISEESKIADTSKLAILTALECLVEITRLKTQQQDLRRVEERSMEQMTILLQNALHAAKDSDKN